MLIHFPMERFILPDNHRMHNKPSCFIKFMLVIGMTMLAMYKLTSFDLANCSSCLSGLKDIFNKALLVGLTLLRQLVY